MTKHLITKRLTTKGLITKRLKQNTPPNPAQPKKWAMMALPLMLSIYPNISLAATSPLDLSLIEVTPHELALTQVLSEICPPLLDANQKLKFAKAYDAQLKLFMPKLDPQAAMQQIGNQKAYRNILNGIRVWTLSYPSLENQALCVEFAESFKAPNQNTNPTHDTTSTAKLNATNQ